MTDNIGIGIIGTGFARRVQIPAFLACENVRIVSVSSGNPENAWLTAEGFKIGHHSGDWRETALHPDVDLVCITTPPDLHCEMALAALEAGKHVLCEKPMAMNVPESQSMCDAAAKTGRLAIIDHELRFQDGRIKAREILRQGKIGPIREVKCEFRAPHRGDPNLPWNWWADVEQGGGALGAIGSHVIDSLFHLLDAKVVDVSCRLFTTVKHRDDTAGVKREVTSDDRAYLLLGLADSEILEDAACLVSISMTEGPNYRNTMEFFGSRGSLHIDQNGELRLWLTGEEPTEIETDSGSPIEGIADTGFARAFKTFAPILTHAVRNGMSEIENAAGFTDGLKIQKILDAARESDKSGRSIRIDI